MSWKENSRKGDLKSTFPSLRLLTFLFIFFIFLIYGTTVLVISSQTKENVISLSRSEVQSNAAIGALQINGDLLASLRPGDETAHSFLTIRNQTECYTTIRY